jgi:5'-nucleotidase
VKIVLTNDDGIDAPGIAALSTVLEDFGEVWTFAPTTSMSGCGHAASEGSFQVLQVSPRRYAVDGKPADCTRVALHLLNGEVDWVFSGINDGANLGVDVFHSGTVAAVREAAFRGIPGFALSHYKSRVLEDSDWVRAAQWARHAIAQLIERPRPTAGYWNVNFPCPPQSDTSTPDLLFCPLEESPLPVSYIVEGDTFHYGGRYSQRARVPGSDVYHCFGGKITATYVSPFESQVPIEEPESMQQTAVQVGTADHSI